MLKSIAHGRFVSSQVAVLPRRLHTNQRHQELFQPALRMRRILKRNKSTAHPISTKVSSYASAKHQRFNVPSSIQEKLDRRLHLQRNHPLNIIKSKIEDYCQTFAADNNWRTDFQLFDSLDPVVDTESCFDLLRIPKDHVSRQPSDTYYLDDTTVLRTHTSAHQVQFMSSGKSTFLCCGDVYRRDEIDSTHYPVFHQMEGVRLFEQQDYPAGVVTTADRHQYIEKELKAILMGLAVHLFGDVPMRWNDDYFPFTEPSFELEVFYNNNWLEVLGCGVVHPEVIANAGLKPNIQGWAFGLGLERLAMILFAIPDIRLFWSNDPRFIDQFSDGNIVTFVPYSKYPACYKDVSFWLPAEAASTENNHENISGADIGGNGDGNDVSIPAYSTFHINDVYEVIRDVAGDVVEKVELFDEFTHKKTGRISNAYRIYYRHMDRSLTNEEVDEIQFLVRQKLHDKLGVTLR